MNAAPRAISGLVPPAASAMPVPESGAVGFAPEPALPAAPAVPVAEGVELLEPAALVAEGVAADCAPLVLLAEGEAVALLPLTAVLVPVALVPGPPMVPVPPAVLVPVAVAPVEGCVVLVAPALPEARFAHATGRVSCFDLPSSVWTVSGSDVSSATPWISTMYEAQSAELPLIFAMWSFASSSVPLIASITSFRGTVSL